MALKSYKSKAFTIKSKKVNKEIFNRGLNTFDNITGANFGYNNDNLTQDDLFMAMRLTWAVKDNFGMSNTLDYTSKILLLSTSKTTWYDDYFHLDLVNSKNKEDKNKYYLDGRISYRYDGQFQLQCFYNVFVENEDGSRKVYSKQLNTNNFKGEPIVINADREYTINIINPTITLSKIFLEYETKEVSL